MANINSYEISAIKTMMRSLEITTKMFTSNPALDIEGFHRMLRKYTKTKTIFPTDDAVRKSVYLAVREISKKWTVSVRDWGLAYSQIAIFFEDRLSA